MFRCVPPTLLSSTSHRVNGPVTLIESAGSHLKKKEGATQQLNHGVFLVNTFEWNICRLPESHPPQLTARTPDMYFTRKRDDRKKKVDPSMASRPQPSRPQSRVGPAGTDKELCSGLSRPTEPGNWSPRENSFRWSSTLKGVNTLTNPQ